MALNDKKAMELLGILNDLVRIHDDRIAGYLHALTRLKSIDANLKGEIFKLISRGEYYKHQLLQTIKELAGSQAARLETCGKIYSAWRDLKVAFSGKTQKAIIAYCLYNEQIALCAYEAALDKNIEMEKDIRQLIEIQESELRKISDEIKKFNTTHHTIGSVPLYFTWNLC